MDLSEDATSSRRCKQHDVPTLLSCARCDTPVCPRCTVWTVVGQKCMDCSGDRTPARRATERYVRPAIIVGALLAIVMAVRFLDSDSVQRTSDTPFNNSGIVPVVEVGEKATDQGLAFVVNRFECGATEVGEGDDRSTAAGQFCILDITVRNEGANPAAFAAPAQLLRDEAARTYALDPRATASVSTSANRALGSFLQLNPGIEVQGLLVFDVPTATVPTEAELHGLASGLRVPVGRSSGGSGVRVRLQPTPRS